jgi:glycosyltransferase involved in cell wall biosynthesis
VRIAIVTEWHERVGGIEAYLESVIPALAARHELGFWCASLASAGRGPIRLPPHVPLLARSSDARDAAGELMAFSPDVIFAHGLADPIVEARLLSLAPAVAVEHTYHGTCISGSKTMAWPTLQPCARRFGPACLALYLPRRCGGSSPLTMARLYRTQSRRLDTLARCRTVVAFSTHMKEELDRHGLERVVVIPPFVIDAVILPHEPSSAQTVRLLYLGRLETLKGPARLIDALPLVAARLGRRVELTIAGDGSDRATLEARARAIGDPRVAVAFVGWQDADGRARLLSRADALVMPSLLPEPFGLVGLEAAAAGVPSVAFDSGGVRDWLKDGETGCLAQAAGGRADLLADAIVRCTGDPAVRQRLATAARAAAAGWSMDRHVTALEPVLAAASRRSPDA